MSVIVSVIIALSVSMLAFVIKSCYTLPWISLLIIWIFICNDGAAETIQYNRIRRYNMEIQYSKDKEIKQYGQWVK